MSLHVVRFENEDNDLTYTVPTGALLSEAIQEAGLPLQQPCGGQGRCGRCVVKVIEGVIRRRSTLRLAQDDIAKGYALACQSIVESDATVAILPQESIERRLTTDLTIRTVEVPPQYVYHTKQTVQRHILSLKPPSMDDQTDDWSRFQTALRQQIGITDIQASLNQLRNLGPVLRASNWQVMVTVGHQPHNFSSARLIDVQSCVMADTNAPLWGIAIDIGTTTVTLWLVDLVSGEVRAQVAEYNGQIARGEDVISRIIYSEKQNGAEELRQLVLATINQIQLTACKRMQITPVDIVKATIVGNSTMLHLLLGIPAQSIRLDPFITSVNTPPLLTAEKVGLDIHPEAVVDCLPGVASYVGADITAGVLLSRVNTTEKITLFIDIGTNGEAVLGNNEWLVTCACSAGPAFEGGGVFDGMRATKGAIEEIWINNETYQPYYRVIGGVQPKGICGSGLISLLAEMFLTGVVDKAGNINTALPSPRIREGEHGPEYVIAWADETAHERNITINRVDIDNLLRAKAAIYAGFSVLAESVGLDMASVEGVLVGGAFGKYINVEKAIEIGLLPDLDWDQFHFLGNTAIQGAYLALLDQNLRTRIGSIADSMTYIELSADNRFYEAFTSAMFLPHTDTTLFPSIARQLTELKAR